MQDKKPSIGLTGHAAPAAKGPQKGGRPGAPVVKEEGNVKVLRRVGLKMYDGEEGLAYHLMKIRGKGSSIVTPADFGKPVTMKRMVPPSKAGPSTAEEEEALPEKGAGSVWGGAASLAENKSRMTRQKRWRRPRKRGVDHFPLSLKTKIGESKETFIGNREQTDTKYVAILKQGDDSYSVIPLGKWYKFEPKIDKKETTLEDVEEYMKKGLEKKSVLRLKKKKDDDDGYGFGARRAYVDDDEENHIDKFFSGTKVALEDEAGGGFSDDDDMDDISERQKRVVKKKTKAKKDDPVVALNERSDDEFSDDEFGLKADDSDREEEEDKSDKTLKELLNKEDKSQSESEGVVDDDNSDSGDEELNLNAYESTYSKRAKTDGTGEKDNKKQSALKSSSSEKAEQPKTAKAAPPAKTVATPPVKAEKPVKVEVKMEPAPEPHGAEVKKEKKEKKKHKKHKSDKCEQSRKKRPRSNSDQGNEEPTNIKRVKQDPDGLANEENAQATRIKDFVLKQFDQSNMVKYEALLDAFKAFTNFENLDKEQRKAVAGDMKMAFKSIGITKKVVDGVALACK